MANATIAAVVVIVLVIILVVRNLRRKAQIRAEQDAAWAEYRAWQAQEAAHEQEDYEDRELCGYEGPDEDELERQRLAEEEEWEDGQAWLEGELRSRDLL